MRRLIAPAAVATILAAALASYVHPWEGDGLTAYRDIVGVWTYCAGITSPGPTKRHYTREECRALNRNEAAKQLAAVAKCIHVPLHENEWIAIGSWSYNVGAGAACGSTLVRMVNAGRPPEVWCEQLMRWDMAGGRHVRGLTRRRAAERDLCVGAT